MVKSELTEFFNPEEAEEGGIESWPEFKYSHILTKLIKMCKVCFTNGRTLSDSLEFECLGNEDGWTACEWNSPQCWLIRTGVTCLLSVRVYVFYAKSLIYLSEHIQVRDRIATRTEFSVVTSSVKLEILYTSCWRSETTYFNSCFATLTAGNKQPHYFLNTSGLPLFHILHFQQKLFVFLSLFFPRLLMIEGQSLT